MREKRIVQVTVLNKYTDKRIETFFIVGESWKRIFVKYMKTEYNLDVGESLAFSILYTVNAHICTEDKRIYLNKVN